nr:Dihydrofolate reductase [uncultured bacterium]
MGEQTKHMINSAIVAMSSDRVIGKDGGLPWHLPRDMKFFKKTTMGHHVIMGRESFASMDYMPLKGRTNIVLTRDPFFITSSAIVMHSMEEAISYAYEAGETEAFIIGGGMIFKQFMHLIEKIYLTEVISHVVGDIYFPELDMNEWHIASSEFYEADDKNEFPMRFEVLQRK